MNRKMQRFLKDTAVLGIASLLVRFVGIAASRFLSSRIGDAGMGLCTLVGTVGGFAATVATAGVGFSVTRLYPVKRARGEIRSARETVGAALLIALVLGTLSALLLLLLSHTIGTSLLGSPDTIPALRVLALSLPFMAIAGALSGYFIAVRRSRIGAVVRVGEQILRFSLLPLFLSLFASRGLRFSCLAVALASAISEGVSCLFFAICFLSGRKRAARPSKATLCEVSATAFPILASSLVRSGLTTLEHLLIPYALTICGRDRTAALASYGILASVALPIALLPMSFLSAAASLLVVECAERSAGRDRTAVAELASRALSATLAIGIGCSTLLLLLGAWLGGILGGGKELTDYLYLLAPAVPLMLVDHVTDAVLRGIGEQVYSMWVNIADAILSILLVLVLLPPLGARGYTTVILLAEIFNLSLSLGRLVRVTGVKIDLTRALLPPLCGAFLALAFYLPLDLIGLLPALVAMVGISSVIYALRVAERKRKDAKVS
jgi:stage V sporulation protein B